MDLENGYQHLFVHKMSESLGPPCSLVFFLNNLYSTFDILSKNVNFLCVYYVFDGVC